MNVPGKISLFTINLTVIINIIFIAQKCCVIRCFTSTTTTTTRKDIKYNSIFNSKKECCNKINIFEQQLQQRKMQKSSSSSEEIVVRSSLVQNINRRRSLMIGTIAFLNAIRQNNNIFAYAVDNNEIPSVTVSEFEEILKQSTRSIEIVDFTGPKGDKVMIKLVDGTLFTLSDVVESSTDPRSPLQVLALCRGYKVPTKFSTLLGALDTAPKKKKVYMNSREVEAAKKEKEKRERLMKDEEERLEELRLMKEEERLENLKKMKEQET